MSKTSNWSRAPDGVPSRNETLGLAERTLKNLEYVLEAHASHEGVHLVTQVVLSLLGIVVFPFERQTIATLDLDLAELEADGWPQWEYVGDSRPPRKLAELTRHLRHATAHGNIAFSSDSRFPQDVIVSFRNTPPHRKWTWETRIRGDQLLDFCRRYLVLIEQRVG